MSEGQEGILRGNLNDLTPGVYCRQEGNADVCVGSKDSAHAEDGLRDPTEGSTEQARSLIGNDAEVQWCVSLKLAVPLTRFYYRSIYLDMSRAENEERAQSQQRRVCVKGGTTDEPPGAENKCDLSLARSLDSKCGPYTLQCLPGQGTDPRAGCENWK